jgi:hypothetical protein
MKLWNQWDLGGSQSWLGVSDSAPRICWYTAWVGGMLEQQEDPVKLVVEWVRGGSYVF